MYKWLKKQLFFLFFKHTFHKDAMELVPGPAGAAVILFRLKKADLLRHNVQASLSAINLQM
jgi:hypothetical protein